MMKKITKLLLFVLCLTLMLGSMLAIATFAADGDGVSSTTVDFTEATSFPWQDVHGAGVPRITASAGGNRYFEWTFYTAPGTVADARYQSYPNAVFYSDYYVFEFDIATATTLPDNFGLHFLCNSQNLATGAEIREGAGLFSPVIVVDGQLTAGGVAIPANESSDWTHITIAIDGVQTPLTYEYVDSEGQPASNAYVSYDETTVNVYADGLLIHSSRPWEGKNVLNFRRAFLGWHYKSTTPVTAGESVAIDNWTVTDCPSDGGTDATRLAELFDGTVTDLDDYTGTEIRYQTNYAYPEAIGNAYVQTATGDKVTYKTLQAAIDAVGGNEIAGDVHLSGAEGVVIDGVYIGYPAVQITSPVRIYSHGHAMAQPILLADLGTRIDEDADGNTVYVYATDTSPAFGVIAEDGTETPYLTTDFTAAFLTGRSVKLYRDMTVAETLHNVCIDLNGNRLISSANGMLSGQSNYIYNNNTEAAATLICDSIVLAAGNDVNYQVSLGYSASGVKAAGRISMTAPQFTTGKTTNTLNLYNVDFYNLTANDYSSDKGLFWQQLRSITVTIDNCNFYMIAGGAIIGGNNSSGAAFRVTVTNTCFYGAGALYSGIWSGDTSMSGTATLNNVKMYGGFCAFGNNGGGSFANRVTLHLDENCLVSDVRSSYTLPAGCVLAPSAASVVLNQTFTDREGNVHEMMGEYAADLAVVSLETTVELYDVPHGTVGAVATETVRILSGDALAFPLLSSYFLDGFFYLPTGEYALYDEADVLVATVNGEAATAELVAAGPFRAYPVFAIEPIAFAIVTDGGYDYRPAADFTPENVDHQRVVLLSDITTAATVSGATIDLDGHKLTTAAQLTASGCYIYNSNTDLPATIYLNHTLYGGGNYSDVKVGYSASGVKADGRIVIVATVANASSGSYGSGAAYYNVDFVSLRNMGANSYNSMLGQMTGNVAWTVESCNFYFAEQGNVVHAYNIGAASISFKNCNVYFANGGQIASVNGARQGVNGQVAVSFENTRVYGNVSASTDKWDYDFDANSTLGAIPFATGHATYNGESGVLVPVAGMGVQAVVFPYTLADGADGRFETTLVSGIRLGTSDDVKGLYASFLRNVNLDTSIHFNLYIPAVYSVVGATETTVIDGSEYYVLTYETAPKDALLDRVVSLTVNGLAFTYNASVLNYVRALLKSDATDAYGAASQSMAKYVLYYVRCAAVSAYGDGADTTVADAVLGDFALTEEDGRIEGAHSVSSISGIVGATLDLDSEFGFVFAVEAGYRGTLSVSFDGKTTVYDYTETAAAAETYIVLGDIAAHDFTDDVVIVNGEGQILTYNLATYVQNTQTAIGYAVYAYAKQAKIYCEAYGNFAD